MYCFSRKQRNKTIFFEMTIEKIKIIQQLRGKAAAHLTFYLSNVIKKCPL